MVRFISYSRLLTNWNLNQPTSYRYKCAYFSEWSVSGNRKYVRYLHVHVASFLIWLAFFAHIERFGVASNWITNGFRGLIVLYNLPLLLLENVCLIGIEKKQIGGGGGGAKWWDDFLSRTSRNPENDGIRSKTVSTGERKTVIFRQWITLLNNCKFKP